MPFERGGRNIELRGSAAEHLKVAGGGMGLLDYFTRGTEKCVCVRCVALPTFDAVFGTAVCGRH